MTGFMKLGRDRKTFLRHRSKLELERNKPYWALIDKCNKMADQLAGLEAVVIGTENECDQFDNRDGQDRLPVLSGRIDSLEALVRFRADIEKSRVRASKFRELSEER